MEKNLSFLLSFQYPQNEKESRREGNSKEKWNYRKESFFLENNKTHN